MTQMIVAPVARKVGEQVLDGVIDMFLRRNALVVAALWRLPILFRALFGDLRRCKHGMGRQHVEGVRRGGLFAALRELDDPKIHQVFARCPVGGGVAYAVQNRLRKAAAFHIVDAEAEA